MIRLFNFKSTNLFVKIILIAIILIFIVATIKNNFTNILDLKYLNKTIKYEEKNGLFVIPSTINKEHTLAIFDTGSDICVIDSAFSKKIKALKIPFVYSKINNDNNKYNYLIIKELCIDSIIVKNVCALVVPFHDSIKNYGNFILGMNVINKANWYIFLNKNKMEISKKPYRADSTYNKFAYKKRPTIDFKIKQNTHTALLDFGFAGAYNFKIKLKKEFSSVKQKISDPFININQHQNNKIYETKGTILLGKDTLKNQTISLTHRNNNIMGIKVVKCYKSCIINTKTKEIFLK